MARKTDVDLLRETIRARASATPLFALDEVLKVLTVFFAKGE
jgi:hypothetical protein